MEFAEGPELTPDMTGMELAEGINTMLEAALQQYARDCAP